MSALKDFYGSERIIDGSKGGRWKADVCIIGSGAGGAMAAATLAALGKDVLVVEEGGIHSNADFTMREVDMYPKLYQESARRATKDLGISILQGRSVGGGTTVNWTTCFRTPKHVLERWKAFTYAELEPHWEWTEKRLAITQVLPHEPNKNNRKLLEGFAKLGWSTEYLHRNVFACMQSGYCGMGCPYNAKRSSLVTLLPDAIEKGARLVHHCKVERLEQAAGEITAAVGNDVRIEAKRFIVSGGAINSPALLLRSGIDDDGKVGARTFLHPVIVSVGLYDEQIDPFYGAPQSVASHHFADRGGDVGLFMEAAPIHPLLASITLSGFGAAHAEYMHLLPRVAGHIALTIDGFHDDVPGGRVSLRKNGLPVLDYPIPSKIFEAMRFGQARLAESQFASGAKKVVTMHEPSLVMSGLSDIPQIDALPWRTGSVGVFSAHQMGGCAMGSVVRAEDLRHQRLKNLYVMDGSVFPTSLGVNPQLSIYGVVRLMATRLGSIM